MVTNAAVIGKHDWDEETGEFVEKYPQEAILTAIEEWDCCDIRDC